MKNGQNHDLRKKTEGETRRGSEGCCRRGYLGGEKSRRVAGSKEGLLWLTLSPFSSLGTNRGTSTQATTMGGGFMEAEIS